MATKIETLTALPLWECLECGRLEFNSVQPDCCVESCDSSVMYPVACPNANEKFEAIGQHFYRDTGMLRPGKDSQQHSVACREHTFENWNEGRLVY